MTSFSFAAVPDPSVAGPYGVKKFDYLDGKIALTLPGPRRSKVSFNQPLRGSLTYPDTPGPWPVALFLHGRHGTCLDKKGREIIPIPGQENPACPDVRGKEQRIRSYAGYQYLARKLASQGYVVISADANILASYEDYSVKGGIVAREQVIGATLDLLGQWNAGRQPAQTEQPGVPAEGELTGMADLGRLAIMGHSRGGDAVTQFIAFNQKRKTIYPLNGVVAIGPTDFSARDPFRNGATNLAELLPACDGDVADLQGGHVFERVKDSHRAAQKELYLWQVEGANHNWFNTIWKDDDTRYGPITDLDSACGAGSETTTRASRAGQRAIGTSLINSFIRRFAGGELDFGPALAAGLLPESTCVLTPTFPCDSRVRTSYMAPASQRLVVLKPGSRSTLRRNALGRRIKAKGLKLGVCDPTEVRFNVPKEKCPGPMPSGESEINRSWTRQLTISWKRRSSLTTFLPPKRADVSRFANLTLRAVVAPSGANPASRGNQKVAKATQRMNVVLTDGSGNRTSVEADAYAVALRPTVGERVRQYLLSDINIPLAAFNGTDLSQVKSIALKFGVRGRNHGLIQISDLAFQGDATTPLPVSAKGPVAGPGTAVDAIAIPSSGSAGRQQAECITEPSTTVDSGPSVLDGRLVVFGHLDSAGCDSRAQVALFKKVGESCSYLSADGQFSEEQSCDRPYSLIAETDAKGNWSVSIPWQGGDEVPEVEAAAVGSVIPG